MAVNAQEYRDALASWASGVTIVTSRAGERIHGMTVSAFTSVSLEPPLVLVCADKSSDTHALIAESGVFCANVLPVGTERLSNRFAVARDEHLRFEGLDWSPGRAGAPMLDCALVSLDCAVTGAHDAGDHVIYVGRVEEVRHGEGEPLLYFRGRYHGLAANPDA